MPIIKGCFRAKSLPLASGGLPRVLVPTPKRAGTGIQLLPCQDRARIWGTIQDMGNYPWCWRKILKPQLLWPCGKGSGGLPAPSPGQGGMLSTWTTSLLRVPGQWHGMSIVCMFWNAPHGSQTPNIPVPATVVQPLDDSLPLLPWTP